MILPLWAGRVEIIGIEKIGGIGPPASSAWRQTSYLPLLEIFISPKISVSRQNLGALEQHRTQKSVVLLVSGSEDSRIGKLTSR